ncbi:lipoprotein-releasing ABC transporter permease subunit [Hydrogenophilus islandicus]
MPFEWWIGWRYVRSQRHGKGGFVSFIAATSMLGMMLGVAVLIVVLSVMNGFQEELRARILGVASHVEVTGIAGRLADWPQLSRRLEEDRAVVATAPFVTGQGLVSHAGAAQGVMVRGIIPQREAEVGAWRDFIRAGSLEALTPGSFAVAIGRDLARQLGVDLGDSVLLLAPDALLGPTGVQPRIRAFRVAALFDSGMYEFDSSLVLMALADAQAFFRMGDAVSGVRVRLADPLVAPRKVREWAPRLPAGLWLADWTSRHANFFRAVQLEKTMMTLILFLIVAVAAFNLVSSLVMGVQEKQADIAILRTIGASPASIMAIFVVEGAAIGVIGLAAGTLLGLWLAHHVSEVVAFLEKVTGATLWNKEVYLISDLPSKVLASDVVLVVAVSLVLTLVATLYPSWRAAHVQPAEALRHE